MYVCMYGCMDVCMYVRATGPCFKLGWKVFLFFSAFFKKNIPKQQHAENAAKSTEIDVSELLKLLNVLRP